MEFYLIYCPRYDAYLMSSGFLRPKDCWAPMLFPDRESAARTCAYYYPYDFSNGQFMESEHLVIKKVRFCIRDAV